MKQGCHCSPQVPAAVATPLPRADTLPEVFIDELTLRVFRGYLRGNLLLHVLPASVDTLRFYLRQAEAPRGRTPASWGSRWHTASQSQKEHKSWALRFLGRARHLRYVCKSQLESMHMSKREHIQQTAQLRENATTPPAPLPIPPRELFAAVSTSCARYHPTPPHPTPPHPTPPHPTPPHPTPPHPTPPHPTPPHGGMREALLKERHHPTPPTPPKPPPSQQNERFGLCC